MENNTDQKRLAKELADRIINGIDDEKEEDAMEEVKEELKERLNSLSVKRSICIVGVGDGGTKISSDVKTQNNEIFNISFNSSDRNNDLFKSNMVIYVDKKDGSGKNRKYARELLNNDILTKIITAVNDKRSNIVMVSQTTGGGTGCGAGPKITAEIADNIYNEDVPVIAIGAYPKLEDAVSIFNTLEWQKDIETADVTYMVFNNNRVPHSNILDIHKEVNKEICDVIDIIHGESFKASDISSMDSKDFIRLLSTPGRLTVYCTKDFPSMGESLDDFLTEVIKKSSQEEPIYPKCQALMIKGPKAMVSNLNTSLSKLNKVYGEPMLRYSHIEIDENSTEVIFITSGNDIPSMALHSLQVKYNELTFSDKRRESSSAEEYLVEDPFEKRKRSKTSNKL